MISYLNPQFQVNKKNRIKIPTAALQTQLIKNDSDVSFDSFVRNNQNKYASTINFKGACESIFFSQMRSANPNEGKIIAFLIRNPLFNISAIENVTLKTPLHYVAERGLGGATKALVERFNSGNKSTWRSPDKARQAFFDAKDALGNTPAHYAGNDDIFKLLIDNGANCLASNNEGHYTWFGRLEIAKYMQQIQWAEVRAPQQARYLWPVERTPITAAESSGAGKDINDLKRRLGLKPSPRASAQDLGFSLELEAPASEPTREDSVLKSLNELRKPEEKRIRAERERTAAKGSATSQVTEDSILTSLNELRRLRKERMRKAKAGNTSTTVRASRTGQEGRITLKGGLDRDTTRAIIDMLHYAERENVVLTLLRELRAKILKDSSRMLRPISLNQSMSLLNCLPPREQLAFLEKTEELLSQVRTLPREYLHDTFPYLKPPKRGLFATMGNAVSHFFNRREYQSIVDWMERRIKEKPAMQGELHPNATSVIGAKAGATQSSQNLDRSEADKLFILSNLDSLSVPRAASPPTTFRETLWTEQQHASQRNASTAPKATSATDVLSELDAKLEALKDEKLRLNKMLFERQQELSRKLEEEFKAKAAQEEEQLRKLRAEHEQQLAKISSQDETQLAKLRAEHADQFRQRRIQHEKLLTDQKTEYERILSGLRTTYENQLREIEKRFAIRRPEEVLQSTTPTQATQEAQSNKATQAATQVAPAAPKPPVKKVPPRPKLDTSAHDTEFKREKYSNPCGFSDVAGMTELKRELSKAVIEPLNPDMLAKFKENGLGMKNGILLHGEPGNGKTFIVEALAAEVGLPMYKINMSQLGGTLHHQTENTLGRLFAQLEKKYKETGEFSILFIDEIDATMRKRGEIYFKDEEINTMLQLMNNSSNKGIFIIGATNRKEALDPAVLRPGRLDTHIHVPSPDFEARASIIHKIFDGKPLARNITNQNIEEFAQSLSGFSASSVRYIAEETLRSALLEEKTAISAEDVKALITKYSREQNMPEINAQNTTSIYDKVIQRTIFKPNDPKSMDDLGGMEDVKAKLREAIINPLKPEARKRREESGLPMAHSVLLHGTQGCGKTYILNAAAAEAKIPIYEVNLSDIASPYIHETSRKLREIFEQLKTKYLATKEPSILFLDEIDALGMKRDSVGIGENHKQEEINTLLQLLNDASKSGVIVVAATNKLKRLDAAIRRTGRFDMHIQIGLPDFDARKDMIVKRLRKQALAAGFVDSDSKVKELAKLTNGFTNSDMAYVLNKAVGTGSDSGKTQLSMQDFRDAIQELQHQKEIEKQSEAELD